MKALRNSFTSMHGIFTLCLAATLWCATGCHSTGYRKGDGAAKSIQRASAEVQMETRRMDATIQALDDLVNRPGADLKPQYQRFSKSLDRLIDSAEDIERTRQRMELKSAEYFAAWDAEVSAIHYGKIREQSEARRAEVTNRFQTVNARYQEAQEVVWALINYFKDIRTAVSLDLTRDGLASVKEIVGNADQNADKVRASLARLSEELAKSGASLSSEMRQTDTVAPQEETRVSVRDPVVTE
jgi:hypothetical protein